MPGVPRELAKHKLKVYPQARPIRQKLCRFTPDKREAIRAELARLVAAGFIREVLHPEWLANLVLVLKKNKVDWCMWRNITVGNIIPAIEFIKYFTLLRSRDTYSIVGYGKGQCEIGRAHV